MIDVRTIKYNLSDTPGQIDSRLLGDVVGRPCKRSVSGHSGGPKLMVTWLEEISEEHWCCGWWIDAEYVVWRAINDGEHFVGQRELSSEQAKELLDLAELACGWVSWDEEAGECVHVPMDEWDKKYEAWLEKR